MDRDYNFSRFVFNEMRSLLSSKKKDAFALYPRFIQLIFDVYHPELVRTDNTHDNKSLGPNTFSLMKQVRKSSGTGFVGTDALVKLGRFADSEGTQASAFVAEEHVVPPETVIVDADLMEAETTMKSPVPTEEEIQALIANLQDSARKPPPARPVISETPSGSESEPSPLIRKRKRNDPRRGVLFTETTQAPTQTPSVIVSTAQAEPSTSAQDPSEQDPSLGDPRYAASVRLAQILESEDTVRPSRRTGIHIGEEEESLKDPDQTIAELQVEISTLKEEAVERDLLIGQLDVKVSDLSKDNEEKTKQISSLQANLGGLTALVFDLRNKLSAKFGSDFQPSASEAPPSSAPDPVIVSPAPDTVINEYLSSGPRTSEESREKEKRLQAKRKGKSLLMKSSDQNLPVGHPQLFISSLEKKKFGDKYGD